MFLQTLIDVESAKVIPVASPKHCIFKNKDIVEQLVEKAPQNDYTNLYLEINELNAFGQNSELNASSFYVAFHEK